MNIIDVGLDFNSNMSRIGNIEGIVLHHSGVTVNQSIETIHNYHKSKGWAGIGYHYYVRKDGLVYKGRPEEYAGAHCPGANSNSIGICAEGNYNEETMPEVQKQAIIDLISDIKSRHNIKWIKGHREVIATSCPGDNFPLDEIRNAESSQKEDYTHREFVTDVQIAEGQTGKWIDGIAGEKTLKLTPTVSISKNRNHKIVTPLEKYLKLLGYYNGEIEAEKGKTPIFGNGMKEAVKNYQRDMGLKIIDGEITARANTWKKLLKLA